MSAAGTALRNAGVTTPAFAVLLTLLLAVSALALTFPPLTGRVVDQANIIPAETRSAITAKSEELESKSGIQLVVATVNSLEGGDVETYANQLFRFWKLGEAQKNNGVLLLVAPNERRVRIEVGYGLEGTLTDALSKVIIANAITPRFKAGDFGDGITRGVDDIITVLTTDASEWEKRPSLRLDHGQQIGDINQQFIAAALVLFVILMLVWPGFRALVFNILLALASGSGSGRGHSGGGYSGGGWSGGGSSGGGFSGGGGSSGGGGASGSW
jgi:uncharacterized protein